MPSIKLLLHSNSLSLRGDSTNAEAIATYLRLLCNIDSIVVAPQSLNNSQIRIDDMRRLNLSVNI